MNKYRLAFILVLACVRCKQPVIPAAPARPVGPPYDYCFYREGYVVQKAGDTTAVPVKLEGTDVVLSPDGKYIAFTDESNIGRKISIMDLATFASSPLDTSSGPSYDPAWSPDGRYIACTALQNGQWNTKIVDLKTRKATFLPLDGGSGHTHPGWGADSNKIIARSAHLDVFELNGRLVRSYDLTNPGSPVIDGNTRLLLTAKEDKIVFAGRISPEPQSPKYLYLFDRATGAFQRLGPDGYVCSDPVLKGDTVFCSGFNPKGTDAPGIYRIDLSGEHFALVIPDAQHFSCRPASTAR